MSLNRQAASSVKWSTVSQAGRQIMQFVTTAILARLLSPADFGLVGMATIVTGFIWLFQDLGTASAVIQRKHSSESLLSSIFWMNVGFGLLGMLALLIVAPLAASFYQEPRITVILRVLSVTFLLSGVTTLQKALLERELAFAKLAKIEISATLAGSAIGISLAVLGWGVWALVYQALTVVVVTTILIWMKTFWQPKIMFNWNELKKVSSYSLNLTGFSIFNYFSRNADYLLVGKFLGTQELGYYTLAYRLMLYPLQNISAIANRVLFPVFSRVQDDNSKFSSAYLKIVSSIAILTFPLMIALWGVAEPFVMTIFGRQWQPVSWLLLILAPVGLLQSIGTTVGLLYQAKGRTDWMFRWGVFAGIVFITSFVIGLHWGIIGVAGAYTIANVTLTYPGFAIPLRLIELRVVDLGKALWRPLFASFLMLGAVLGLKAVLPTGLANGWILAILVTNSCVIYLLASWYINRSQMQQMLEMAGLIKQ